MTTQGDQIRNKAVELLKNNPNGLRYSELVKQLHGIFPTVPLKSIPASIWDLNFTRITEVSKPSRGLFKYRFSGEVETVRTTETIAEAVQEEEFYEPFANWLTDELGECTVACALGSNYLGKKWGTPDVIGIYKPSTRDVIKFQPEVISAEIKINPSDPITAFGQAITYRLFSSKVYLVEPSTMIPEDQDRIEALCILFGIGLILFDLNTQNPNFRIRVRAQRYSPDMFYVNEFADKLYNTKKATFNKLFG
jgi:hypothetical protein